MGGAQVRPRPDKTRPTAGARPARRSRPPAQAASVGGDRLLLDDVFRKPARDSPGRQAGYRDGIRSVVVGVAASTSAGSHRPVTLVENGTRLGWPSPGPQITTGLLAPLDHPQRRP